MNFECGCNRGPNPFFDPNFPLVKVSATLNDTSAIIHVGDTLIFKLTIPDAFIASNGLGATQTVVVNTLQTASYAFHFYRFDTVTKRADYIYSSNNIFVTAGRIGTSNSIVYVSDQRKPFTSVLHLVPPGKGLYAMQVIPQADWIKVNKDFTGGLVVNFNMKNKNWDFLDPYFPGYAAGAAEVDSRGYGWYCFKVE
jgi:hypothetical protein